MIHHIPFKLHDPISLKDWDWGEDGFVMGAINEAITHEMERRLTLLLTEENFAECLLEINATGGDPDAITLECSLSFEEFCAEAHGEMLLEDALIEFARDARINYGDEVCEAYVAMLRRVIDRVEKTKRERP
jgi:hypothetical protein